MVCDLPHWKKTLIFTLVHHRNVNMMSSKQCQGSSFGSGFTWIFLVRSGSFKELWQFARSFILAVKLESELLQIRLISAPWFYIYGWTAHQTVALKQPIFERKKRFVNLSLGQIYYSITSSQPISRDTVSLNHLQVNKINNFFRYRQCLIRKWLHRYPLDKHQILVLIWRISGRPEIQAV
jgi:hypothetical protein